MEKFKIGQTVFWAVAEFDCHKVIPCKVKKKDSESVTIEDEDGISYYFPSDMMENVFTSSKSAEKWLAAQPRLGWY